MINWITSKEQLWLFVEKRVKAIKQDKEVMFHYISTLENPADMAGREVKTLELKGNTL